MPQPAPPRLDTLDALRGVAAIVVVAHHLGLLLHTIAPVGYLAVDFFFVLSGFVVSRAYDARLAGGMSGRQFMLGRLIRLYPLYLIGLALGFMVEGARILTHEEHALSFALLGGSTVFGAFMLPTPGAPAATYPLNFPSWSLLLELAASAAYALIATRLGARSLIAILCVTGVGICAIAATQGTINIGDTWNTLIEGAVRTAFSFTAGMLIQRHGAQTPRTSAWAFMPAVLLIAALLMRPSHAWIGAYDVAFALLISPAIVALSARFEPPAAARASAQVLGEISYPLYMIHMPLIYMAGFVGQKLMLSQPEWVALYCAGVMPAAWMMSRLWDRPARHWIAAHLPGRRASTPAGAIANRNT